MPLYHVIGILVCLLVSPCIGSMSFSNSIHTAKATGMGGAYTGYSQGPEAIFYNWASPATDKTQSWKIEQGKLMETPYVLFAIQNPFNIQQLRLGLLHTSINNIAYTALNASNQPYETGSTFKQQSNTLVAALNRSIKSINLGLRNTLFIESLEKESGFLWQIDSAIQKSFSLKSRNIHFGFTQKNSLNNSIKWSTNHTDASPQIRTVGVSVDMIQNKFTLASDIISDSGTRTLATGLQYYFQGSAITIPYATIRLGYQKNKFAVGLGINLENWIIDYSWTTRSTFSSISNDQILYEHRFSIGKSLFKYTPYSSPKKKTEKDYRNAYPRPRIKTKHRPTPKYRQPTLFHSATLISNPETNTLQFKQKNPNPGIQSQLNTQLISNDTPFMTALPSKWIIKTDNSAHVILIDIDSTQSKSLILSGFLPPNIKLLINNSPITKIHNNGQFYKKLTQTTPNTPITSELIFIQTPK